MKFLIKQKLWTTVWLTLVILGVQGTAWADDDDIERIFFFGDSLSDSGNAYLESGKLTTQPPYTIDEIVPTYPYDIRGFQFSNGKTWARIFAKALETRDSGKASLKEPRRYTNYAYGGARARQFGDRPSAVEQLAQYANDFPGSADEEDLYVIQFGGNDLRDVFAGEGTPEEIISAALQTKAFVIMQLYTKGARNFLVANVPDISFSPAVKLQVLQDFGLMGAPMVLEGISNLVKGYNEQLNGIQRTAKRDSFPAENVLSGYQV
jgi:phospholipase/lecithinase/hemolysin